MTDCARGAPQTRDRNEHRCCDGPGPAAHRGRYSRHDLEALPVLRPARYTWGWAKACAPPRNAPPLPPASAARLAGRGPFLELAAPQSPEIFGRAASRRRHVEAEALEPFAHRRDVEDVARRLREPAHDR